MSDQALRTLMTQVKIAAVTMTCAAGSAEVATMMSVLAHTTGSARPHLLDHAPHVLDLLDQAQRHAVELRDDAARSDLVAAHGRLSALVRDEGHSRESPAGDEES
ncbi:hypothetical protein [Amycolatopsis sp. PS_44_ISF1]|uniref:hypothetical protein n=1 Tax=Amycolatopsis sp. PS_44_ISF1 TaxID=2974917 RepID=UPI0028DE51E0|nr:hypothetical protein [Amycolatopsis sp. PS_44_ISF1]MDT8913002.1 hypothetical protein [Amycolatopsis sp. PS_44_ISF1]